MKFSRDAAISRIPAPHLLKQGQLQLAGASFRDMLSWRLDERVSTNTPVETGRVDQWHGFASLAELAPCGQQAEPCQQYDVCCYEKRLRSLSRSSPYCAASA